MKYVARLLASVMFLVSVLGICLAMAMQHEMPMTGDCLRITSRSVVCPMGLGEHLDAWKSALVSQAVKFFSVLLLVFWAVAIFIPRAFDAVRASPKRLWRESALVAFFLPLKFAFSRGILHPKIFSLA